MSSSPTLIEQNRRAGAGPGGREALTLIRLPFGSLLGYNSMVTPLRATLGVTIYVGPPPGKRISGGLCPHREYPENLMENGTGQQVLPYILLVIFVAVFGYGLGAATVFVTNGAKANDVSASA